MVPAVSIGARMPHLHPSAISKYGIRSAISFFFFFFFEIHVLLFIYLFIYDCVESSFLCEGFL